MGGTFSDRYDEEAAGDFSDPSLRVTRQQSPTIVINQKNRPANNIPVIYIGRPSMFGNPFRLGIDGTRDQVLLKFERYARDRIAKDHKFRQAVEGLRGRTLSCWCKPLACHGDTYVKLLDEMERGEL